MVQIGSIVFKYNEDLTIRLMAISRLKVDEKITSAARDRLEDLREQTNSKL